MHDDAKHITEAAIPRLVSNIKRALRKSCGITTDGSRPRTAASTRESREQSVPFGDRLQNLAGYSNRDKKALVSKSIDPNIILMQLAQLLHLATPS